MPCGIIPSGRAPKSIVVTLTCIDLPTAKGWQNRRFFNVLPKRARQKKQARLLLYYYCLCKSFNELFHVAHGYFVPESGCKGRTFFNNKQAFLRKISN